jgi:hypothetical protein
MSLRGLESHPSASLQAGFLAKDAENGAPIACAGNKVKGSGRGRPLHTSHGTRPFVLALCWKYTMETWVPGCQIRFLSC